MPPASPGRRVGADDDDVLVDQRHRVVRHHHVHFAGLAEAGVDRAGLGVERDQTAAGREDDAWIAAVTRPIRDAAPGRRAAGDRIPPDFLAGLRLERHDAVRGRQIHDAVDDDRRRLGIDAAAASAGGSRRGRIALQGIGPHARQLRDVPGIDLLQRRIAGAGQVVAVHRPVAADRLGGAWLGAAELGEEDREHGTAGHSHHPREAHGLPPFEIRSFGSFYVNSRSVRAVLCPGPGDGGHLRRTGTEVGATPQGSADGGHRKSGTEVAATRRCLRRGRRSSVKGDGGRSRTGTEVARRQGDGGRRAEVGPYCRPIRYSFVAVRTIRLPLATAGVASVISSSEFLPSTLNSGPA